jgi:nucleotide-binding universal stress UspA family protein
MPTENLHREWQRRPEEEEYFHKLDAELIDRMRRRASLEETRRLLARASGINDHKILEDLEKLGYNCETVSLLHLVPLVHVAWISGSVTPGERKRILEVARIRGAKEGTPAHLQLSAWLNQQPPEAFFQSSLHAIRMILQTLPAAERKARKDDLIQYCTHIASASGGLLGFGRRICTAEKNLLGRIAAELEKDHQAAARQVVEEIQSASAPSHLSSQFFKKILLVVDEECDHAAALDKAVSLAKENNGLLTLAGTSRAFRHDADGIVPQLEGDLNWGNVPSQTIEGTLDKLATAAGQEGIATQRTLLRGTPFLEVIREVLRNDHDVVIVPTEGDVGLKRTMFGTTALKLLRKCPCPVWAVRRNEPGRDARILAAVDLDPSDEECVSLNNKIMELAISVTRMAGSELHVIHAWTIFGQSFLMCEPGLSGDSAHSLILDNEKVRQQWLTELLQQYRLDGLAHQVHLLHGEAGTLIPEIARRHAIDLIVMGTVGRTGIPGLIMGNTAEKVLAQVNCSVLAVKPDGFITPVVLDQRESLDGGRSI